MLTREDTPTYLPNENRYQEVSYARCGNSGLLLPQISLGLWQNFGDVDSFENARHIIHTAFDLGITHFDLANNYGTPYGSAEKNFGRIFRENLTPYRDELIISSKAGYDMWPGPYGIGGSRKYLMASCDQSLQRTGLEYFDIFYHHCPDPDTPIEETVGALASIVQQGKALYIGISNYNAVQTQEVIKALKLAQVPLLINQVKYNILEKNLDTELKSLLLSEQVGSIVYSPLAQGLLTNKYLKNIPQSSRAANKSSLYLNASDITPEKQFVLAQLNDLALARGQSLAQMAIAWTLNNSAVTSCLIGASSSEQVKDSISALNHMIFSAEELKQIEQILSR